MSAGEKFGMAMMVILILGLLGIVQFDYRQLRDLQRRVGQLEQQVQVTK